MDKLWLFRLEYMADVFLKIKELSLLLVTLMKMISFSELTVISSKSQNFGKLKLDSFLTLSIFSL